MNHLGRGLLLAALLALAWAAVVALTGGVYTRIGPLRVSSTNPTGVLRVAAVAALALGLLSLRLDGRRALRQELQWLGGLVAAACAPLRRYSRFGPIVPALAIVAIGLGVDAGYWAKGIPLWLDEEMIALNIRDRSFADLAGPLWLGQSAPYGWLAIERAAVLAFGDGERTLRAAPMLFGAATLVAALVVGLRWLSAAGAALFVLLCASGRWVAHYRFEVKHYTADIFWGLVLPAVAVWAIEAPEARARLRRCAVWFVLAAIGLWFANGALFVTPACGALLVAALWRRDGLPAALRASGLGVVWLVSFALCYQVSVRHTLGSHYLWNYWSNELPGAALGFVGTIRWLVERLRPLALNPGGATDPSWIAFWAAVIGGLGFGAYPALRATLAAVVLSPFVLAAAGVVPLYERFSIWAVPALYLGIALLVDRMLRAGREALSTRRWLALAMAFTAAAAAGLVCLEIVRRGADYVRGRAADENHGFDDSAAVRWLMAQRRPGDAIATTRLAWPAVWWYGRLPVARPDAADGRPTAPMYEVFHSSEPECHARTLAGILAGHPRVLVYLGFQDFPAGFDDVILQRFGEAGAVVRHRDFASLSRAAVVDLRDPPSAFQPPIPSRRPAGTPPPPGCVGLRPMRAE